MLPLTKSMRVPFTQPILLLSVLSILVTLEDVQSYCIEVSICIFLISDYIDHLFLSVLDISILALSSRFLLMFILSCPPLFIFSKFWGSKDSFRFTEKLIGERWKVTGYANTKRKVFTCNSGRQSLSQELLLEIKSIIS